MPPQETERLLRKLFADQKFGVLATQHEGCPFTSLVSFASTSDLREIIFVTGQATRKYAYLVENAHVSMLIDSRSNRESDIVHAIAVTVTGVAEPVPEADRDEYAGLYLSKHPYLEEFVRSPSTAILRITVEDYTLVSRFQEVTKVRVETL